MRLNFNPGIILKSDYLLEYDYCLHNRRVSYIIDKKIESVKIDDVFNHITSTYFIASSIFLK